MGLKVLSLFDGISCGRIALERAGIEVDEYYASEIDDYAIKVSKNNYPDIIQLGDVKNWPNWNLKDIDLIIGGSPCQGFSFAGKQLNFEDPRSKLFFEMNDIIKEYKPKYFFLENVKMKKESMNIITSYLGVNPIQINSNLVSAQNRSRLYWTNIPSVTQPEDKNIKIQSILGEGYSVAAIRGRYVNDGKVGEKGSTKQFIEFRKDNKSNCLTTVKKDNVVVSEIHNNKVLAFQLDWRYLNTEEYEKLQTLPLGYTKVVNDTQRYKMIGNAWTVDVIAHIFKGLK